MSAGQKVVFVHVGDGASRGHIHVTADKNGAYCRSGNQRIGLTLGTRSPDTHHRRDSGCRQLAGKLFESGLGESVENEWRINGLQVLRINLDLPSRGDTGAAGFLHARVLRRSYGRRREALVELIDLQHLGNRSHATDGFLGERADLKPERAYQLSIDVDQPAAHIRHYSAALWFLS